MRASGPINANASQVNGLDFDTLQAGACFCNILHDVASFECLTWEKSGDAGGVAQAGSNSEIHELHR